MSHVLLTSDSEYFVQITTWCRRASRSMPSLIWPASTAVTKQVAKPEKSPRDALVIPDPAVRRAASVRMCVIPRGIASILHQAFAPTILPSTGTSLPHVSARREFRCGSDVVARRLKLCRHPYTSRQVEAMAQAMTEAAISALAAQRRALVMCTFLARDPACAVALPPTIWSCPRSG
jgi:hypothetical protein